MSWAGRVVVVLVALGCGAPSDPVLGQSDAVRIVWRDVYGRSDTPPWIRWVTGDELNCYDHRGFMRIVKAPWDTQICVTGVYWVGWNAIELPHYDGFVFSRSSLAHEHFHALLDRLGERDENHEHSGFAKGGDVDRANARLAEWGL